MARKNIFELLNENNTIQNDIDRLNELFSNRKSVESSLPYLDLEYSLKEYIDLNCFSHWKQAGKCLDLNDFLATTHYYDFVDNIDPSEDELLWVIEIIYNLWYLACNYLSNALNIYKDSPNHIFKQLQQLMDQCLSEHNCTGYYNADSERFIVVEDNPEAFAVAELLPDDIAHEVILYNYRGLKGNITEKKKILLIMGNDLEPRRKGLDNNNRKSFADDIFFLLNNLNIRHNNINPVANKKYKKFVADMDGDTLESWYDELYQMMLLANLELAQTQRAEKVAQLKKEL